MDTLDITKIIHNVNREVQIFTGEEVNPEWDEAPDWMKESTVSGITGVLNGNTPEMSHESWMKERTEAGWIFGFIKNIEAKVHPCLVPYSELPADQLFVSIVNSTRHL